MTPTRVVGPKQYPLSSDERLHSRQRRLVHRKRRIEVERLEVLNDLLGRERAAHVRRQDGHASDRAYASRRVAIDKPRHGKRWTVEQLTGTQKARPVASMA